jgi:hypothetical protein
MSSVFLIAFIAGLLLAVRIMFFGAERRRTRALDAMPLRRSEPAMSALLLMFGIAGYLLTRPGRMSPSWGAGVALVLGALWAALVTRLAIVMVRVRPEHDPDDPRFLLQGQVAMVTEAIPAEGEGVIAYEVGHARQSFRARSINRDALKEGVEVCIERVEDGIAFVEPWAMVEARL